MIRNKKHFFNALINSSCTIEELFEKNINTSLDILDNSKIGGDQKANYLARNIENLKISKNILSSALLSYHNEFHLVEKNKFEKISRGFAVRKENFFCYLCGKKISSFYEENEEIVFFPDCNHFFHVSCEKNSYSDNNFFCKQCIKIKNSTNEQKFKIK